MKPVTLHDGRVVDSSSDEWRLECESRAVLRLPAMGRSRGLRTRRDYLDTIEKRRGIEARKALESRLLAVWEAQHAKPTDGC